MIDPINSDDDNDHDEYYDGIDEYSDDSSALEDEFATGDGVIIWSNRGIELGFLIGFNDHGVVWRRTHRQVSTGPSDDEWEFGTLQRSVLTFLRWEVIDRLESYRDIMQENDLRKFSELMLEVEDSGDFTALVEAASDEDNDENTYNE